MTNAYSKDIKNFLSQVKKRSTDLPELYAIFERCYGNTLETTITELEDHSVFLLTGDIPAMWLRDSTAQMRPYLFPARNSTLIRDLIAGVVKRQFFYINIDPYANAFNKTPCGACYDSQDLNPDPWLWERKFELDSLCYPVQLSYLLWKNTGCTSQFDSLYAKGAQKILDVFETEQYHEEKSDYRFVRNNTYHTETLSRKGNGSLTNPGIGLIWSGFRPSDDACTYGYSIPGNMFASVILGYLGEIAADVLHDPSLASRALKLKQEVETAIETWGKTRTKEFGTIYAYEIDGYGMYNLMDDANTPGLLSMEYFGYKGDKEVMENTKKFILTDANPYYFKGKAASGLGSPHTHYGNIWHISMAIQGLIASSKEEKLKMLQNMAATTGGTGLMHESFFCDDDRVYTREWFSWANAIYSELFLDYLGYELEGVF